MLLKRLQERLVTIAKNLAQLPYSQAPTLVRQSGWLYKENFYLFFL
nr:MAG TPA: transposase DNA-binding protein [Caudoviricetes sp.]